MKLTKTIRVGVYGGMVQWVEDIPEGTEVQVFDYDTDGVDDELLSNDCGGNPCVVAVYACCDEEPEMLRRASEPPLAHREGTG